MLQRVLDAIRKRGVKGTTAFALADFAKAVESRLNRLRDHGTKVRFEDRSTSSHRLVLVLAGYKKYLWPATLDRITRRVPAGYDVCICSPGTWSDDLASICAANGWSYLSTQRNSPGVALNAAIARHPDALGIHKIDEDIVIGDGYFERIERAYYQPPSQDQPSPGICAPLLNVNGISTPILLEKLGLIEEYKSIFGSVRRTCDGVPAQSDAEACKWIWRHTLPFDQTDHLIAQNSGIFVCSTRFSIGAIFFEREFIMAAGGFASAWQDGVLGIDEEHICASGNAQSRPLAVACDVLAGHFSFQPQERLMRNALPELSAADPMTFPPGMISTTQSSETAR